MPLTVPFLTSSLWMARIRSLAASQLLFLPVMTIISELLFSVGRSILVFVSSRICSIDRQTLLPLHPSCSVKSTEGQKNKSYFFDVGTTFTNDVFVKLLKNGNGQREAVLNLQTQRKSLWDRGWRNWGKDKWKRTRSAMIFWRNLAHFSTSFFGPLNWTMSLFCAGSGKLMITWK